MRTCAVFVNSYEQGRGRGGTGSTLRQEFSLAYIVVLFFVLSDFRRGVFVDIGAIVDDYIHYYIVCLGYPRIISF
jgi:hypothetical protein